MSETALLGAALAFCILLAVALVVVGVVAIIRLMNEDIPPSDHDDDAEKWRAHLRERRNRPR